MSRKNDLSKPPKASTGTEERENPSALPGWPGYRNRDGRSGYDPIDMPAEAAHVSGAFIRELFAGQLKIRNPVSLVLSGLFGIVLVAPVLLAIAETMRGNLLAWEGWLFFLIAGMVGLALLVNFVKNLHRMIK